MVQQKGSFSFNCYNYNGHILAEIGDDRYLIDTGALQSFGAPKELLLAGKPFQIQKAYLGHGIAEIEHLIGTRISAVMGVDILNCFETVIDLEEGEMTFSTEVLPFTGVQIPVRFFHGIPVISCCVGEQEVELFLDSGAKLSFLDTSISSQYPRSGEDTDFFPGFGEFKTDVYKVPLKIAGLHLELSVGTLPDILQMTLTQAKAAGIIGSALYDEFAVCLSAARSALVVRRHSNEP